MLASANKIATDTRNEILAEARAEAEKVTARARDEITAEKEKAMSELRAQVADLALEAAAKLVRSDMNATTQRRLVEEFLTETPGSATSKARKN
jgi:F-type H+-transporting ATPase subunit b